MTLFTGVIWVLFSVMVAVGAVVFWLDDKPHEGGGGAAACAVAGFFFLLLLIAATLSERWRARRSDRRGFDVILDPAGDDDDAKP